jgi:hypothetical protein
MGKTRISIVSLRRVTAEEDVEPDEPSPLMAQVQRTALAVQGMIDRIELEGTELCDSVELAARAVVEGVACRIRRKTLERQRAKN